MPSKDQIERYKSAKSEGQFDSLTPEDRAKYETIYEPLITVPKSESFIRGAGQSTTAGFQDEGSSAIQPVIDWLGNFNNKVDNFMFGDNQPTNVSDDRNYSQRRDDFRQLNDAAQVSNPKTFIAGEVAGTLPTLPFFPKAAATAVGATTAEIAAAAKAARLASLGTSTGLGALFGAGSSDADTAGGVVKDTAIGAALGLGTDLAFMGGGKLIRGIAAKRAASKELAAATQLATRKQQLATETIEDFVASKGGKVTDDVAKEAQAQGFHVPEGNAKSLQVLVDADQAAKNAGEEGIKRNLAMSEQQVAKLKGQDFTDLAGTPSYKMVDPSLPKPGLETNLSPSLTSTAGLENKSTRYVLPSQLYNLDEGSIHADYNKVAALSKANLDAFKSDLQKATGLEPSVRIKSAESYAGKLERYRIEGKDPATISDTIGGRIVVKQDAVPAQLQNIQKNFKVIETNNYFETPSAYGYQGVNLKVELPNGQLSEIQIHTPQSERATAASHKIYEKWRNVDLDALTPEQQHQYAKDLETSRSLFDKPPSSDQARTAIGYTTGFKPSEANIGTARILESEDVKATVEHTAKEIAKNSGSGTPSLANAQIPDPSTMGGAPTVNKIANINLRNIPATEEDMLGFIQQGAAANKDIQYGGRQLGAQTMTREHALQIADETGINLETASKRDLGRAWNGPEAAFIKNELTNQYKDLWALGQKIDVNDPAQKLEWTKQFMNNMAFQATAQGGISESARALALTRSVTSLDQLQRKASKTMFSAFKDGKNVDKILARFKELDPNNTKALGQFINNLNKTTFQKVQDGIYFSYINSLLSGPKTMIVNGVSNSLASALAPVEQLGAATVDAVKAGAGKLVGKSIPREHFFGEAPANIAGMAYGLKQGARAFLKSMAGEVSDIGGSAKFGSAPMINPIPGIAGDIIGIPGRVLEASDDFFKAVNYTGGLYSHAYRQAAAEGVKGKVLSRMADLIDNPTANLINKAKYEATYRTFRNPLGPTAKSAMYAIQNVPGLKYVQPFVTTPINITKYGMERTPLGFLQLATKAGRAESSDVISKAGLGTLALVGAGGGGVSALKNIVSGKVDRPASQPDAKSLSAAMLLGGGLAQIYAEGALTGAAPDDPEEKKTFYQSGKKPYSVKIGKDWVSYGKLEPLATSLGFMADAMGTWDKIETQDGAYGIGISLMKASKNFANKSFMQGLSNMMDAYSNPEQNGERFMRQFATGMVPFSSALRQVGNMVDPTLRSPDTLKQAFQGVLPFSKADLPPMYDIWGQEIKLNGGPIERVTTPVNVSPVVSDKATTEVDRLNIKPGSVRKAVGKDLELTDPMYHLAQQMRGQYSKMLIDRVVSSPGYDKTPDLIKTKIIDKMFSRAGDITRAKLQTTANSAPYKGIMDAMTLAQQRGNTDLQDTLKNRLQLILDKNIVKKK